MFFCAGVWTNTCCSHQLYGQTPEEVDTPESIASGSVPGAKAAAVRKLHHELGINPEQLPVSSFKYLTRLHYCAADIETHGPQSPWGEHEVDYILLAQVDVELRPNPEEVQVGFRVWGLGGVLGVRSGWGFGVTGSGGET
jgi:isopentenyl-diphosphate delta-isomerase